MMADPKMIFSILFSKQFLGLPKWQSDKQQIVFRKHFRDFCPVIWAFCQIFSRECSGTSVPLSGHFAFFFSRTHFRDFCSVIWAFCGFFSQGTFQGLLSRYLGILPFFFQETFQGLLSRYLGILRFFFRKHFRDFCPVIWAFCRFFFSRLAKTAEQLSNFWKLLKIENWFKFSILQKVLCCSFHFVPVRFKNWFWFPRNVPGTSVSFSDRILPNMAPKKKIFQEMFRRFCFLPWENARFSLENAWFSLEHAWFSLENAWFSWENAWFSWENAWFSCENAWSSWENPWFSQHD